MKTLQITMTVPDDAHPLDIADRVQENCRWGWHQSDDMRVVDVHEVIDAEVAG